jgi:hypothetical protein
VTTTIRRRREMRTIADLYDKPGAWFLDHPHSRRKVAAVVAVAALAVPAAAGARMIPNPGGIGQYHAPHGASLRAI